MRVIPSVTENGVGAGVKHDDTVKQYGRSCAGWQVGRLACWHVTTCQQCGKCVLSEPQDFQSNVLHNESHRPQSPKMSQNPNSRLSRSNETHVWESAKLSEVKDVNRYITGCTGSITFSGYLHDILMTIFLKLLSIKLTLVHFLKIYSQSFCCKQCWILSKRTIWWCWITSEMWKS